MIEYWEVGVGADITFHQIWRDSALSAYSFPRLVDFRFDGSSGHGLHVLVDFLVAEVGCGCFVVDAGGNNTELCAFVARQERNIFGT